VVEYLKKGEIYFYSTADCKKIRVKYEMNLKTSFWLKRIFAKRTTVFLYICDWKRKKEEGILTFLVLVHTVDNCMYPVCKLR
jgi:hypothetical protein